MTILWNRYSQIQIRGDKIVTWSHGKQWNIKITWFQFQNYLFQFFFRKLKWKKKKEKMILGMILQDYFPIIWKRIQHWLMQNSVWQNFFQKTKKKKPSSCNNIILVHCGMGIEGAKLVLEMLSKNSTLETLDLSSKALFLCIEPNLNQSPFFFFQPKKKRYEQNW